MTNSFLIIRLSSLGDIIHTLPAFALLRKNFPKSKISWIVENKGEEILKFVSGIDKIIKINSFKWRKNFFHISTWKEAIQFRKKIKNNFNVAFDFQGLIKSGIIAYLSKSKQRFGFNKKNLKEPISSYFYTHSLNELDENLHVIRKNIKLLELIGIKEEKIEFPIKIPSELIFSIEKILKDIGYDFGKKLVLINIGGGWETKRWDIDNFIKLAKWLKGENTFPLFLWGTKNEKELASKGCKEANLPLLPFLSIPELMAIILKSSLLISGDSFPLHFASANFIPVVGIFGPTNPERNGPIQAHDRVIFNKISCSFCYKKKCSSV
jgi:lipopolysaccharide heptosyltransferase I